MSAAQRRRGKDYENEVARALGERLGLSVKRNLGQARDSGDDITLPKSGRGRFRIECKRRREISCEAFLRQAEAAAATTPGDVPIVIMRADGCESMVVMRLEDFLPMLAGELGPCTSPP